MTPAFAWIPEVPLIAGAIVLPIATYGLTGYRAGKRTRRIAAGAVAGGAAGAISGAAIRTLLERKVRSRILVLTTYDTDNDVVPAIQAGATGYLLKDSPREELLRAVRAAFRGESALAHLSPLA